jgi:hypothetical protein
VNGCEQSLNTLADCGACDAACDLANATESCGTGTCEIASCTEGFANCDDSDATGCELRNSGSSNAPPGEYLGGFDADTYSGFLCPTVPCYYAIERRYPTGRYFEVTALEGSTCSAPLRLRFNLDVPAGVDFDLFVSTPPNCDCLPSSCFSGNLTGLPEEVLVVCPTTRSATTASRRTSVFLLVWLLVPALKLTVSAGSCM